MDLFSDEQSVEGNMEGSRWGWDCGKTRDFNIDRTALLYCFFYGVIVLSLGLEQHQSISYGYGTGELEFFSGRDCHIGSNKGHGNTGVAWSKWQWTTNDNGERAIKRATSAGESLASLVSLALLATVFLLLKLMCGYLFLTSMGPCFVLSFLGFVVVLWEQFLVCWHGVLNHFYFIVTPYSCVFPH